MVFTLKKGDLVDEKKIQKIFVAGQNKKLMELIERFRRNIWS